jgi:plastocyanin
VAPSITTHPVNSTIGEGQPASFIAVASGIPSPTFQWERSAEGTLWGAIQGATSQFLMFTSARSDQGAQFRMKASNVAGNATSNPATLTVQWAPSFTTQPSNQSVTSPAEALFSVAAEASPPPTYQWQSSPTGVQWASLSGATSPSLSTGPTSGAMNNTQFRCVATNAVGSANSNPAVLLVNVPTFLLAVTLGSGATGTPATSAPHPVGTPVNYSYSLLPGFTNLQVLLDDSAVPASGTVTMNGAHSLAISAAPIFHNVTFSAGPGGSLTGSINQSVAEGGSTTPVTAIPDGGFSFVNWTGAGFTSTGANPLTLSGVTQAYALTANFNAVPSSFTLTVSRGTGVSGTPSTGGSFSQGTVVPYSYSASSGFTNLQVLLDGIATSASGHITMDADHSLIATAQALPSNTIEVGMGGLNFQPDSLTVTVGTLVTFHWASSGHSVVIGDPCTPSGALDTGIRSAGFSVTLTPTTAGDIKFFCSPHCGSGMRGVIHVNP